MAAKEGKPWWDPYETSHRKQFVYQPNSAAEFLVRPMSTTFIDSYSRSGSFGSTVYKKEFCWKPVCKPECIRTATASGHRRNNPHPSQSFMMWKQPRDAAQSSDYVAFPWNSPTSEGEIRKALTAQYCSTYRCNFMGMPQGRDDFNKAERRLHNRRHIPLTNNTEMRANYRQLKQKPELQENLSHYAIAPNVTSCGIVPTVVKRHVDTQQKGSDMTTYDQFCGKRLSNVTSLIKSLLPQELQQLHRILPEKNKATVQTVLKKDACAKNEKNVKLPEVGRNSSSPEWISSWPGPL
ncbi:testis-expressed protein 26-like [Mugil cephalus]|uniref:testis-expressed protein 26-like n=1 Tax=Mugil cephalus TaxID=48193 RepID=UPI001FB6D3E9|nr:testis-expressed protein 26-like [Mugil cephalus]